MFKSILLFVKKHIILTVIATIVIVGGAVSALIISSIVEEEQKLTKSVEASLNMLVSSDFKAPGTNENGVSSNVSEKLENQNSAGMVPEKSKDKDPLTFEIVKYEVAGSKDLVLQEYDGDAPIGPQQGIGGTPDMSQTHIEYRIVPSYDKDFSEWTKEEKEAYDKCIKEIAKIADAEYRSKVSDEEKLLQQAQENVEREIQSFSETYTFSSGSFRYNSYTKKYSGCIFESGKTNENKDYTIEEFRNNIYPILLDGIQNMEITCDQDKIDKQNNLDRLNTLYHLSD